MKRNILLLLAALLTACVLTLVGCRGDNAEPTPTETVTDTETGTETAAGSEEPTESETAETPTTAETEADTVPVQEKDVYATGYGLNMLVGFDEQGRVIKPVSGERDNKQVGIFFTIWMGQPFDSDVYDVSAIIEQYGVDEVFKKGDSTVSPNLTMHWWGKPLWGYYNSGDEWVIRKQLELLTSAGVDFLVMDVANGYTYDNVAKRIMKVIAELRHEGWDAPQTVFYTHAYSIQTVNNLYITVYSHPEYADAWYRVDGKPMIIAYDTLADDLALTGPADPAYNPGELSDELKDFFYFRKPRWPSEPLVENGWPYTEVTYPQPINGGDMISVSLAGHPKLPFSGSVVHKDWINWGRGYDFELGKNVPENVFKGTYCEAQWKTVYEHDPDFVMITGWNEWMACKQPNPYVGGEYMLVDNASLEYSRDIEPMSGGYEDAYYIQMIARIRQYKNVSMDNISPIVTRKTVDIAGDAAQWNDVNAVYRRVGSDDGRRRQYGSAKTVYYETEAVKNNILEVRVTNDADNIYMYIKTKDAIGTLADGTDNSMNIFIGLGSPAMGKGWEGYEFAVNRARSGNRATVERLNADYTGVKCGEATFTVNGNVMQVSIPRSVLSLAEVGDLYFKVADGVEDPAEIMSYYATGRSLPLGRLSYQYNYQ